MGKLSGICLGVRVTGAGAGMERGPMGIVLAGALDGIGRFRAGGIDFPGELDGLAEWRGVKVDEVNREDGGRGADGVLV